MQRQIIAESKMESIDQEHKRCNYQDNQSPNQTGRSGNWRPHDTRSQLSELEKSLNQFTTDIDSLFPDLEDADAVEWNDVISYFFNKIKTTRETLAQPITKCRPNLARENQEHEIECENKQSKEIEVQNSQHCEEMNKLLH